MKKHILFFGFVGLMILFNLTSCNISKDCPECFTPPDIFGFRLIDKIDSKDLITSGIYSKDSIYIYYLEDNVRKDLELVIHTDSSSQKTTIYSNSIGWTSISGFKDYFLQLNGTDIDTLYLNVEKQEDDCCTFHPYKSFKYNGQLIQFDNLENCYLIKK